MTRNEALDTLRLCVSMSNAHVHSRAAWNQIIMEEQCDRLIAVEASIVKGFESEIAVVQAQARHEDRCKIVEHLINCRNDLFNIESSTGQPDSHHRAQIAVLNDIITWLGRNTQGL